MMLVSFRAARLANEVDAIARRYIAGTPLWDEGTQRTVTRHLSVAPTAGQVAARVGCRVLLHAAGDRGAAEYSAEWTHGLLGELAVVLRGRAFDVAEVRHDDALVGLDVRRAGPR